MAMTIWWAYLLYLNSGTEKAIPTEKLLTIIKWEGGTLIVLLILLSLGLLSLYFLDNRRTKELQTFFSTLTHELKTPLASIRLQAEVLQESINSANIDKEKVQKLISRLINESIKMENRMDKILQFNRLGKVNDLNMEPLDPVSCVRELAKNSTIDLDIQWIGFGHSAIEADRFALDLIFKNLFENTKNHGSGNCVKIELEVSGNWVLLYYRDSNRFDGDLARLGSLFYKHNSSKGTGIGLHLVKNLMQAMKGDVVFIQEQEQLVQRLSFARGEA